MHDLFGIDYKGKQHGVVERNIGQKDLDLNPSTVAQAPGQVIHL